MHNQSPISSQHKISFQLHLFTSHIMCYGQLAVSLLTAVQCKIYVNVTNRQLLLLAIWFPRLDLKHQQATRSKLFIHPTECPLETNVTVVEMNPLCNAQTKNHVILHTLLLQLLFRSRHILTLNIREQVLEKQFFYKFTLAKINLHISTIDC